MNDRHRVVLCELLSGKERTTFSGPWKSTLEFYHENNGEPLSGFGRESSIAQSQSVHRTLVTSVEDVLEGPRVPPRHRGETTVAFPEEDGLTKDSADVHEKAAEDYRKGAGKWPTWRLDGILNSGSIDNRGAKREFSNQRLQREHWTVASSLSRVEIVVWS